MLTGAISAGTEITENKNKEEQRKTSLLKDRKPLFYSHVLFRQSYSWGRFRGTDLGNIIDLVHLLQDFLAKGSEESNSNKIHTFQWCSYRWLCLEVLFPVSKEALHGVAAPHSQGMPIPPKVLPCSGQEGPSGLFLEPGPRSKMVAHTIQNR